MASLQDSGGVAVTDIAAILEATTTIALLGASANPARPSNYVMEFLVDRGFRVHPINPVLAGTRLHGSRVYAHLADLPEPVDLVDVFRASENLPAILDEMLALSPRPKVLWTQYGVVHEETAARARAAGFQVVMDRCLKTEVARHGVRKG